MAATREKVKPNNKSQASDLDTTGINTKERENGDSEKEHPIVTEWKHLTLEQINLLLDLTVEEVQLQLEDTLNFKHRQTCLKEAALLDYFVSGFWWAKEMHFTCQQVSGFMALLQLLLDNIREKQMPLVDNFAEFSKAIAGTRQPLSPPDSSPLFDVDQAISITDYFKSSLFQHYELYEFLFTQPREERLFSTQEHIEVVNPTDFIPPLEEGMPVDVFFRYMTQTPVEEAKEVLKGPPEIAEEEQQEAESAEKGPSDGGAVDASQEVLGQVTEDPVENPQEDVSEKLQVQKESSSARKGRPKKTSSK
ncbi:ciliary-associated calcium-binding coiled-coil protein 1 [Anguilla anguilla]|uniref:ciliary-associated calcium-binding coiled-coil protein 1 n=1 Tax=Anguilla anguilla TaxID=7936 RepID=UPI0015B052BE|nr:ciliary-associated calcium-binding coiled-coil protein 1 [Anguilla anguilla]